MIDGDHHKHFVIADLHCYGCAHSAAGEPYPGGPSGERPCQFCIRNPWINLRPDDFRPEWYDGTAPVGDPMDAYQTAEMRQQWSLWLHEAEHSGAEALNRLIDLKGRLQRDTNDGR
jgi:hypothetical protein